MITLARHSAAIRGDRRQRIEGIQVVSLEGLLRLKAHGRLKDRADAEAIRKALDLPADD